MLVNTHIVSISTGATASSGSGTIAETEPGARILSVHCPGGSFATTTVATITVVRTGQSFTVPHTATGGITLHYAPRQLTHTATGGVSTQTGDSDFYYCGRSQIAIDLTLAGLSKTGTIIVQTG